MSRALRTVIALALAVLATVSFTAVAGAQPYTGATFTGSTTVAQPGQDITFSGTGFKPNSPITVTVDSVVYNLTSDALGAFSIRVPAPRVPGAYEATATDGTTSLVFLFQVAGATGTGAVPVQAGSLPYTGGNSAPFVQIGFALLAVGALITILVRTRRTTSA